MRAIYCVGERGRYDIKGMSNPDVLSVVLVCALAIIRRLFSQRVVLNIEQANFSGVIFLQRSDCDLEGIDFTERSIPFSDCLLRCIKRLISLFLDPICFLHHVDHRGLRAASASVTGVGLATALFAIGPSYPWPLRMLRRRSASALVATREISRSM